MKYRFIKFIINCLLKDNIQQLIVLAIVTRIEYLEKLKIENKFIDYYNIVEDISSLNKLKRLFSTKLYN